jgi:hypothetical protein
MKKQMFVLVLVFLFVGCRGAKELTGPSPYTETQRATIPSNQTGVIKIKVEKVGDNLATVTFSEDPNVGLAADKDIKDWNGAKFYVVRKCDGKESQSIAEYSNDEDSVTRKRTIVFPKIATCAGNLFYVRIRVEPVSGGLREFTFPTPSRVIREPVGLELVTDATNGFTYIKGTL